MPLKVDNILHGTFRFLQLAFSVPVLGIYAADLARASRREYSDGYDTSEGYSVARWTYAVVVAALSVLTYIVYATFRPKKRLFFLWDFFLFEAWTAVFSIFVQKYINPNVNGTRVQLMQYTVLLVMVNMQLWFTTAFFGGIVVLCNSKERRSRHYLSPRNELSLETDLESGPVTWERSSHELEPAGLEEQPELAEQESQKQERKRRKEERKERERRERELHDRGRNNSHNNEKAQADQLYREGRFAEASQKYSQALNVDVSNKKNNSKLLMCRVQCHMKLEQFSAALADCETALRYDARNKEARKMKAQVMALINR